MQPDYQAIRWDTLQLDILLHRKPVVRSRLDGADSGAAVAPVVPDAPKTAICSGLPVPRGRAHPFAQPKVAQGNFRIADRL